ncbi:MAG: hypothetical protein JNL69_11115 [Bacteroidia bacterium]|nr:hypothetical protein [Bacteroidia bacterium]
MKTTVKQTRRKNVSTAKMFVTLLLTALSFYSYSQNKKATNYRITPGLGAFVSGNGHGAMYEGSLYLSNGKNVFSAGVLVQKRKTEFCGATFSYIKPLFSKEYAHYGLPYQEFAERNVQLFLFSKGSYFHKSNLSYNTQTLEEKAFYTETDIIPDFSTVRFSTVEVSAGFGLNVKLGSSLVWGNYIGFGTYYHLDYIQGMHHDRMAPVITFGTSLRMLNYKK